VLACPAPVAVQSPDGLPTVAAYPAPTVTNGKAPVTTVCTPASGSSFPIGTTAVACVATDAQQRTSSCGFSVTVTPPPTLSATRFVAFGDSITWGEDGSNDPAPTIAPCVGGVVVSRASGLIGTLVQVPVAQTYPGALKTELVARYVKQSPIVANQGCPGEDLTDSPNAKVLSRFSSDVLNSGPYDVVLLMEGTNDLVYKDSTLEPQMMAVLRQMLDSAKGRGVRPYLATIPPMNPAGSRASTEYGWYLVPEVNDQIRALAASENVTLVDVYQALNTDVGTLIGPDGVHPTVAGYAKIADTFFAAIKGTLEQTIGLTATAVSRARTGSSATPAAAGQGSRAATATVP
jgi:lysophospholipase L1-like esterase